MSQLSKQHLPAMIEAARAAGIPLGELKPVNPFSQQGQRATMLQSALQVVNPVAYAELRNEAGIGATLETVAVKAGLVEMTESAHKGLMASDGQYVIEQKSAEIKREADLLASYQKQGDDMERNRLISQRGSAASADKYLSQRNALEQARQAEADRIQKLEQIRQDRVMELHSERLARAAQSRRNGVSGVTQ